MNICMLLTKYKKIRQTLTSSKVLLQGILGREVIQNVFYLHLNCRFLEEILDSITVK